MACQQRNSRLPNEVEFGNHERHGQAAGVAPCRLNSRDETNPRPPQPDLRRRSTRREVAALVERKSPKVEVAGQCRLLQHLYKRADPAAGSHSTLTKSGFPGRIPASLSDLQFSSRARTRPRRDIECEHLVPTGNL